MLVPGKSDGAVPTGGDASDPPSVADGVVYGQSVDGRIAAYDAATGGVRWRTDAKYPGDSSLAVAKGLVFSYSRGDGPVTLSALDAGSGRERWRVVVEREQDLPPWDSTPVVAASTVYVGEVHSEDDGVGGRLLAIDALTGTEKWSASFPMGDWIHPVPLVAAGTVMLVGVGAEGSQVIAFDAATGEQRLDLRCRRHPPRRSGRRRRRALFHDLRPGALRQQLRRHGRRLHALRDGRRHGGSPLADGRWNGLDSVPARFWPSTSTWLARPRSTIRRHFGDGSYLRDGGCRANRRDESRIHQAVR